MKSFEALKKSWQTFRKDPPGRRFQERYRRHRANRPGPMFRVLLFLCGLTCLLVGVFFMLVPGPGIPIAAAGAALIANQSLLMARALDQLELAVRRVWRKVRGK